MMRVNINVIMQQMIERHIVNQPYHTLHAGILIIDEHLQHG